MPQIFTFPINKKFKKLSFEIYEEVSQWAQIRNPKNIDMTDDAELSKLSDLLILLRLGYFNLHHCECKVEKENLVLEILL